MRRREFLGIPGGAAVLPIASKAQQAERMRHTGMLKVLGSDDPEDGRLDSPRANAGAFPDASLNRYGTVARPSGKQ